MDDRSGRLLQMSKAVVLPAVVCIVALALAGKGMTSEASVALNGDMPRYLMNGVYFYDLLSDGIPADLMRHAQLYFAQYPALTLGHHPMVLPLAEVPFFALLGVSVASGRATMLFFLLLGLAFWFFLVKLAWDETVAFWSSLLLASSPLIVAQSRLVMSEISVFSMTIVSMYWYYRFSQSLKTRDLVLLVMSFALACYAKQLAVFALPVFIVHFSLRHGFKSLFSRQLIVAGVGLVLALVPLLVITLRFSGMNVDWVIGANNPEGFTPSIGPLLFFFRLMWEQGFVAPVVVLGLFGIGVSARRAPMRSSLFFLWIASSVSLVIYIGLSDPRMAVYWLPPFAMFAALSPRLAASANMSIGWITPPRLARGLSAILVVSVGLQIASAYATVPDYSEGYEEAAEYIADDPKGATVLFSSWVDTGYFVFFMRKHDPDREFIVLRANKILSTSYYNETVEDLVSDLAGIYRLLDDYGTCYVVIEDTPTDSAAQNMLRRELVNDRFILRKRIPLRSNDQRLEGISLLIYEYADCGPPRPDAQLLMEIPMGGFSIDATLGDILR